MTIREDAGKILIQYYINKVKGFEPPTFNDLQSITKWDDIRLNNALEYCVNGSYLDGKPVKESGRYNPVEILVFGISIMGINIVESLEKNKTKKYCKETKFYTTFNFNINIESLIKGEFKLFG